MENMLNTQFIKYNSIKGITLRLHPPHIHHLVPYRIVLGQTLFLGLNIGTLEGSGGLIVQFW